ncbi:DUF4192 domain-containing protein (plasmid) [Mycolicibacterium rufum]|uniref:DUF4192 domain-containing protein n=1 Tax=Mycolicibacterium rufum TaxID=318424 RepID=A0A9X2YHL9_9MYCO|nr:DUF4192 domain-containing protein [Mycolicibacterium rufum]KGI66028.1 hypothetical protein EU78_28145 [Mycolicibacterium rufum]MCV7073395.1 DUF4192 domain-containing protein [Mycolicibacterium rufum]ULP40009.1 DUF4192 domain-containing protein [Mycolicibacterium rufum]
MTLDLRSSTDVLAAVPALLGFAPTNSIVGIVIDDDGTQQSILVAARYDSDAPLHTAIKFVNALPLRGDDGIARSVLLIAIADAEHQALAGHHLDAISRQLHALGSAVFKRLHADQLDAGHSWTDVDTGEAGRTVDYRISDLALRFAVEEGRSILGARADIAAEFTPGDPAPEAEITADVVTHTILSLYAALNDPDGLTAQLAANTGHLITTSVTHRDALLVISATRLDTGGTLWTRIARQLRGIARIEALALAAACFYAGNDSVRAGLALDAAQTTAADNGLEDTNLVALLDTALQSGLPPAAIRQMLARLGDTPPTN